MGREGLPSDFIKKSLSEQGLHLLWREAGPPNHQDDKADSDQ